MSGSARRSAGPKGWRPPFVSTVPVTRTSTSPGPIPEGNVRPIGVGVGASVVHLPSFSGLRASFSPGPQHLVVERTERLLARWFSLKEERGCLSRTIVQYRWAVQRAFGYLKSAGRPVDPRNWSADDARWLRSQMRQDPWRITILADLARFSGNFVFYEVGLPPKPPPKRVRWLSEDQIHAILEVTKDDPLLRVVVLLGLGQGLRRIEWRRLRVEDVDFHQGRILVRGKGRGQPKLAWMPLHPSLAEAIERYLEVRNHGVQALLRRDPTARVPPELLVHPRDGGLVPYTEGGPNEWMTRIERKLGERGVVVKLSTHMLRRSGATLLEKTLLNSPESSRDGVYRSVQEFLRHENIATTMRYLESNPARQRKTMDTFGRAIDWGGRGGVRASEAGQGGGWAVPRRSPVPTVTPPKATKVSSRSESSSQGQRPRRIRSGRIGSRARDRS